LIQAEAVADLIHARSELQRAVAERQLSGSLSRRIDALADDTMSLLAVIEANIDFIEEGIDALDVPRALSTIAHQRTDLDDLLATAALSRPLRDGYRVVIAGPVNAGKSSLFNRLIGEAHAIVTEIPGTTRDVLRETVVIEGVPFVFYDTAGLRDARDRVEAIGIERARDAALEADVVLFVVDASVADPLSGRDVDHAMGRLDAARALIVWNKADLPTGARAQVRGDMASVRVSARTGENLDALRREIMRIAGSRELSTMARDRVVLNTRVAGLMRSAREKLDILERAIETREPLEIMAVKARDVLSLYEEATGRKYHDGLLDAIFSRFCIGK
jgi:tRNA modification GTPase